MDKFVIRGGNPLLGTIRISGAKNAALPAMAAALLTEEPVILENIPQVRDIETERKLLAAMGAEVELGYGRAQHRTMICCRHLTSPEAGYELVKTMRASTLVLGPLVARCGPRVSPFPAAAPSARVPSTCTSKDWNVSAQPSARSTATSKPAPNGSKAIAHLRQDHRHRHRRPADGRRASRRRDRHGKLRPRA